MDLAKQHYSALNLKVDVISFATDNNKPERQPYRPKDGITFQPWTNLEHCKHHPRARKSILIIDIEVGFPFLRVPRDPEIPLMRQERIEEDPDAGDPARYLPPPLQMPIRELHNAVHSDDL